MEEIKAFFYAASLETTFFSVICILYLNLLAISENGEQFLVVSVLRHGPPCTEETAPIRGIPSLG
jgi:hypothetical protein